MQTLEVFEKDLVVQVPSEWGELSPEQIKYIFQQLVFLKAGKIDPDDFRISCFYKLANIQRDWRTLLWEKYAPKHLLEEKNANAFILAKYYTEFLFTQPKENEFPEFNFDSVVNPIKQIKLPFLRIHGPADLLSDLTFAEFRAALEEMNSFFASKNPHDLNRMIACLYRPAAGDPEQNSGRIREPFNRERLDRHAKKYRKLKHWQRLAILFWFTWCIKYLQTGDLLIEGKEINLSPLFPESRTKKKNGDTDDLPKSTGLGWTGVLYSLAKEGVFGDIEKTDKAGLFDVLLFMYDNHLQNERIKAHSKK